MSAIASKYVDAYVEVELLHWAELITKARAARAVVKVRREKNAAVPRIVEECDADLAALHAILDELIEHMVEPLLSGQPLLPLNAEAHRLAGLDGKKLAPVVAKELRRRLGVD